MKKEIWIETEKYEIPAVFVCPDIEEMVPCVILCHGTGSQKHEVGNMFGDLAECLLEQGVASIRFDFAGCGDSKARQQDLTFLGEVADVKNIFTYLCSQEKIDSKRIGILGFSQGARVMAEVLKDLPSMKCAVSWSGACHNGFGIFENLFGDYYQEAVEEGIAVIPMDWREDLILSREWFEEIIATHPMEGFAGYKGPVFIAAGKEDTVVDYHHSEEIFKLCKNQFSVLKIYEKADHTYYAWSDNLTMKQQVIEDTVQWICQQI